MVQLIVSVFFYALFGVFIILVLGHLLKLFYSGRSSHDITYYVTTEDGWRLAVHRRMPKGPDTGAPIILCHGLSSNHHIFDLPNGPSLMRWLSERGRDVWAPDLRGSGDSDSLGLFKSDAPLSWEFEDHLRMDLPVIIDLVQKTTGFERVHWLGHSMGGMLIRAAINQGTHKNLRSAITIGSPIDFSKMQNPRHAWLLKLRGLLNHMPAFPLAILARCAAPVAHFLPKILIGGHNPENVKPVVSRTVMAVAAEMLTSGSIWSNFGRFIDEGRFGPESGGLYVPDFHECRTPCLAIGGALDALAPPEAVLPVDEEQTRDNPKCVLMGKDSGAGADYGHIDLMVGLRVEKEIYPLILDWVRVHDQWVPEMEASQGEPPIHAV